MTTPNEELLKKAKRLRNELDDSNARLDRQCVTAMYEIEQALQSQAERIAELERESETHSKAYGLAIVERDNLRHELKTAQEGWRCECSTDDACRFARERDALRAELAEIAATEPVGKVEIAHDINDAFMRSLPIGTKLFTRPMPAQVVAGLVEALQLFADALPLERSTIKTCYAVTDQMRDAAHAALSKYKGAK